MDFGALETGEGVLANVPKTLVSIEASSDVPRLYESDSFILNEGTFNPVPVREEVR